ncbi:MAG: prolipoprotein diacylglyceryl transferase, partial [Planctomycetota bacterium]
MTIPPGYCLLAVSIKTEDLTSPNALILYGLAGFILILWILGVLLLRGSAAKSIRAEVAVLRGALVEVKDLIDGLHESVGRSSDGLEFFREKVDSRLGSLSRSIESLPRVNEGIAELRESVAALEKDVADGGPAGGGIDPELKAQLDRALSDLDGRDKRIAELQEEIAGFHETLQASALAEEQGSEESVFKVKLAEMEEARKKLDTERASFERNQKTIKTQIREAGEKLKHAKDDLRREKEELEKVKALPTGEGLPAGDEALTEEKTKLEREWKALEEQQNALQSDQEWVESERKALEDERDELEKIREEMDRQDAPTVQPPGGLDLPETEVIEEPPSNQTPVAAPEGSTSPEDLNAWGYSSLAAGPDGGQDLPNASEEDITTLAETASDEKTKEEWEGMLGETQDQTPEAITGETVIDESSSTLPVGSIASGNQEEPGGLAEETDLPGLGEPLDGETAVAAEETDLPIEAPPLPDLDEELQDDPSSSPANEEDVPSDLATVEAPEEDLAVDTLPAPEEDLDMGTPPAPALEDSVDAASPPETMDEFPPEPGPDAQEEDVWDEEAEPEPADSGEPPRAPAVDTDAVERAELDFEERVPGIDVAVYASVLAVRTKFDEMKNDQAHALDEVIFGETSDKEDRILLDLSQ